jgi:hypothetical protein
MRPQDIRPHTPVSIRQHTSAYVRRLICGLKTYVRIRQHSSGGCYAASRHTYTSKTYVSIRQHASGCCLCGLKTDNLTPARCEVARKAAQAEQTAEGAACKDPPHPTQALALLYSPQPQQSSSRPPPAASRLSAYFLKKSPLLSRRRFLFCFLFSQASLLACPPLPRLRRRPHAHRRSPTHLRHLWCPHTSAYVRICQRTFTCGSIPLPADRREAYNRIRPHTSAYVHLLFHPTACGSQGSI